MKILAISPRIPEESKKGDQILSFNRLAYLARSHQIQLVCFGHGEEDMAAKQRLESLGINVQLVGWQKLGAGLSALRAMFNHAKPFQCALFESSDFRGAIASFLSSFQPDVVYAVTIRALGNLNGYKGPLFVDMVDSMALNFSRRVDMAKGAERFALNVEYQRVNEYEKQVAQIASHSFVVSNIDKELIGSDKVDALPLGIDMQEFVKSPDGKNDPVIAFTGNMNYKPNADAVIWFYKNSWVKLQQVIPSVRLVIAGNNPRPEVIALRSDNKVTVTGRVASLAAVLNSSRVSIAPMQSGSGMQFKILEAMACGVPVVASTLGLGDISAVDGQDIILADTPNSFTDAVISLLQSESLREKIGDAGLRYVQVHHSWDAINERFEQALLSTGHIR